jgi:hypothetical protein
MRKASMLSRRSPIVIAAEPHEITRQTVRHSADHYIAHAVTSGAQPENRQFCQDGGRAQSDHKARERPGHPERAAQQNRDQPSEGKWDYDPSRDYQPKDAHAVILAAPCCG